MEEHLRILKNLLDKRVTLMKKIGGIWGLPEQNGYPSILTKH